VRPRAKGARHRTARRKTTRAGPTARSPSHSPTRWASCAAYRAGAGKRVHNDTPSLSNAAARCTSVRPCGLHHACLGLSRGRLNASWHRSRQFCRSLAAQPAVATSASPVGRRHRILPPGGARAELVHEGHGGDSAIGTVNSVNAAAHTVNVSHGAIQALGWPPMTMDFPVSPSVNLNAIKPGAKVNFTLDKGSDGMPVIDTITPAGRGK
jgi:Cu(I)/Ag(I) efflux system protein CusF